MPCEKGVAAELAKSERKARPELIIRGRREKRGKPSLENCRIWRQLGDMISL